jgi:hypothetical protein
MIAPKDRPADDDGRALKAPPERRDIGQDQAFSGAAF